MLQCRDRLILIDANAGSSKTTTLAFKAAQAVREGIQPGRVLGITYTAAAVQAFEQRLRAVGAPSPHRIRVRTFNALCARRLALIEGPVPYHAQANSMIYRMVGMAIANARERAEAAGFASDFGVAGDGTRAIPDFLMAFQRLKGTLALQRLGVENRLTPQAAQDICGEDYTALAVLQAYERLRLGLDEFRSDELRARARQGVTAPLFRHGDDPCHDMAMQLRADDPIFDWEDHPLRLNLQLILLDEGHDMNEAMFTVLQQLIHFNKEAQVVGVIDKDQVLHTHSGADARFMSDEFRRWIGTPTEFKLPQCQRFGESVATLLARHADKPYAHAPGCGTERRIERIADVATLAGRLGTEHKAVAAQHGHSDGRLAVLLRHPGACTDLEFALGDTGTAYRTHGFEPYVRRPEIQVLRTLIAWATANTATLAKTDTGGCVTALAEFTGFNDAAASDTSVTSFAGLQHALGRNPAAFAALPGAHTRRGDEGPRLEAAEARFLPPLRRFVGALAAGASTASLPALFDELCFEAMCRRALVFDETVKDAMHSARQFVADAARFKTFDNWLKIMADNEAENTRQGAASVVNLYAIPASKGLEFDHVMLLNVDAGDFDGPSQEERNLFYVAASRAKSRLTVTYRHEPSSYLVTAAGNPAHWMLNV